MPGEAQKQAQKQLYALTMEVYRIKLTCCGAVAELADAEDLKSSGGDTLWVSEKKPKSPLF